MNRLLFLLAVIFFTACNTDKAYESNFGMYNDPDNFRAVNKKLTDVIVHDIFSPPVASRIYAYTSVAAYEVLVNENPNFKTLSGQLTGFEAAPKPEPGVVYSFPLASYHAYLTVGKALIFSEDKIEDFQTKFYQKMKDGGIPDDVYDRSISYGDAVAKHVLAWADKDNYKQTRTFPKYTVVNETKAWKPTPPDYMEGIEPHWNKIRPFVVDSASQFVPNPPTPFDLTEGSKFHTEMMEVYHAVKDGDPEKEAIASFWDCNPFVSHHKGHAMFATKKITPGGHWMGITSIATKGANSNLMETVNAYTRVSMALADGFIVCWDEKWRSILVRPETVINEFVDEDWVPLLQTPPFPEHTSGHSVISTAAATVLTDLYGENFNFVDSTEVEYGLPIRNFQSFRQACDEAAISRLYGGIHYMPAITEGVLQGEKVGEFIISNLTTNTKAIAAKKD
jgi:hypothetical protein